jgi:hypothetical protein
MTPIIIPSFQSEIVVFPLGIPLETLVKFTKYYCFRCEQNSFSEKPNFTLQKMKAFYIHTGTPWGLLSL